MRAWSRSKSLWPITTLILITNFTSPNYTDRTQVNIHCIENFSQFTIFEQLALPLKKTVALKIFAVVNILFTSRIFNNLRFPWKTEFPLKFFTVLNIFFTCQDLWATALALKTELPRNFSLYWVYFLHSGVLNNLRLPWKTEGAWIHSTECIFCIIHDFCATCACPEKQSCPGILHCIEYTFYIQEFWTACAYLKNRACPEFTVLNIYFLLFRIFEQLALALKNTVPWNF